MVALLVSLDLLLLLVSERREMETSSVLVVADERLAVKLMVFTLTSIAMNHWVMVDWDVINRLRVSVNNFAVVVGMKGAVRRTESMIFVKNRGIRRMIVFCVGLVFFSRIIGDFFTVSLSFAILLIFIIIETIEWKGLVDNVSVLNTMMSLRLNHMEELVVLVLNIMHHLFAMMLTNIVIVVELSVRAIQRRTVLNSF